jgi:tRNA threonylcarbamoyladenosine biosynthesis protein TsaE
MGRQMVITLGRGRQVSLDVPWESAAAAETVAWGAELGGRLPAGCVVGLCGELGAGKTVLAGALLHGAGLDRSIHVTSPTFTLMNRYPGGHVHVDLYRIESVQEAFQAGIEEVLLDPGPGLVVVEWFEKFPGLWPGGHLRLDIEITGEGTRLLRVGGSHD